MLARNSDVPRVVYLLAVAVGLVGVPFMYVSIDTVVEVLTDGAIVSALYIAACFALGYAALGAVFGLLWPGADWRWGVWLCAAPSVVVPYFMPDVRVFLGWATVALLPACAGAHLARRLLLKYFGEDSGRPDVEGL